MNNHNEDELPLIKVDSLKRIFKTEKYMTSLLGMGCFSVIGVIILLINRSKIDGSFSTIVVLYTGGCLICFLFFLVIPLVSFIILQFISSLLHFVSYIVYGLSEIIIKTVEEYYKININESNE